MRGVSRQGTTAVEWVRRPPGELPATRPGSQANQILIRPEASVRFWLDDAGGSAKWSKEATQKVTMVLFPHDVHGAPLEAASPP